ncbi:MAG: hypothetical protein AB1646_09865 [Thermodesulfobacteriota bacterium]
MSALAEYDLARWGGIAVLPVSFGPRALVVNYSENFEAKNLTRNTSRSASKAFRMYGGGGFVAVNAGPMLRSIGRVSAVLSRSPISVTPTIYVGGAYGKGNGMEYYTSEMYLRFLLGQGATLGAWARFLPRVVTEFGYTRWGFKEIRDDLGGAVVMDGILIDSFKNTDVTSTAFLARVYVTF